MWILWVLFHFSIVCGHLSLQCFVVTNTTTVNNLVYIYFHIVGDNSLVRLLAMVNGVTAVIPATWEAEAGGLIANLRPVWATESDPFSKRNKTKFKRAKEGPEFNPQ